MTQLQDRAESSPDKATHSYKEVHSGLDNHRLNNEDDLNCVRNLNENAQNTSAPECFPSVHLIMTSGGEAPPENLPGAEPNLTEEQRLVREKIRDENLPGAEPNLTEEQRLVREKIRDENLPGAAPNLTE